MARGAIKVRIFQLLRDYGRLSTADLADELGMKSVNVSIRMQEFRKLGIVRVASKAPSDCGRPLNIWELVA